MGGVTAIAFFSSSSSSLFLFYIDSLTSFQTLTVLAHICMSNLSRIRVGVVSLDLFSPIFDLMSQEDATPTLTSHRYVWFLDLPCPVLNLTKPTKTSHSASLDTSLFNYPVPKECLRVRVYTLILRTPHTLGDPHYPTLNPGVTCNFNHEGSGDSCLESDGEYCLFR